MHIISLILAYIIIVFWDIDKPLNLLRDRCCFCILDDWMENYVNVTTNFVTYIINHLINSINLRGLYTIQIILDM